MIYPTDLHLSSAPNFKTFQVFLICCPKRPSFSIIHRMNPYLLWFKIADKYCHNCLIINISSQPFLMFDWPCRQCCYSMAQLLVLVTRSAVLTVAPPDSRLRFWGAVLCSSSENRFALDNRNVFPISWLDMKRKLLFLSKLHDVKKDSTDNFLSHGSTEKGYLIVEVLRSQ
jgi:hypothetical protein